MKLSALTPYSFRALLPKVKARIAEEARRRLIVYPDGDMVQRHLSVGSTFCRSGGVIFWQIGHFNEMYDGKIMYYRSDCHRDHDHHPTWAMNILKSFYLGDDPELIFALQSTHCLFGTHLLEEACHPERAVAVVEAEKTAVIMSEIYTDFLWMAAGGMNELTPTKLFPLRGRKIILFPDTDEEGLAYANWYKICRESERFLEHPIYLSSLLEQKASPDQKRRKIDILDYYFETIKPTLSPQK